MTKPLLAILLLLPLSVSAGELDGKGIICQRGELLGSSGNDGFVIRGVFGVEFRDGTAVVTRVVPNSRRALIEKKRDCRTSRIHARLYGAKTST